MSVEGGLEQHAFLQPQDLLHILNDVHGCRGSEAQNGDIWILATEHPQELVIWHTETK